MILLTGWWYTDPFEKYDFVSWDDDIPNIWKNAPIHQPVYIEDISLLDRNTNCPPLVKIDPVKSGLEDYFPLGPFSGSNCWIVMILMKISGIWHIYLGKL